ncbi:stage II sporulation protein M [Natrialbaceae archaeon A-CW1-1]
MDTQTRSQSTVTSATGRLVLALTALSLLTAVYLGLSQESALPAVGATLLALGFAAFLVGDVAGKVLTLGALEVSWVEHRRYVGFAAGTFGFGILLGVLLYVAGVDLLEFFLEMLGEEFTESESPDPDTFEFDLTAEFFILNNTPPFLFSILGAVTLGLFTLVVMVFNGILIGNIGVGAGAEMGFDLMFVLLVPHGIFELTALFIAAGVGFRLVHRFAQRLRGTRKSFLTKAYIYRTLLFVFFGWLLLVLAAFVEAYVTIALAEFLYGDLLE